jgi:hypothetical protein
VQLSRLANISRAAPSAKLCKKGAKPALSPESVGMKTNTYKIGAALLAVGICVCCTEALAQTSTTVTTSRGAFTEFVPGSETLVVRSEANTAPMRYVVTKQTTFVDETGAPVLVNQITPGSPLSVQYITAGDRLVASRIVVQHAPVAVPNPNVVERSTTTTTTTRALTHHEREALEHQRHEEKERAKDEIEKRKDALDKAKDALDDDDGH